MSLEQILAAIPHRPPMLLLDEIVSHEGNTIVCRKTFRPEEYFFQGHYPDYPIVPGVILCEAVMQAGAVLICKSGAVQAGFPVVGRLNDVKFKRVLRPGDSVEVHTQHDETVSDAYFFSGKIVHDGKPACTLSFVVKLPPRETKPS
ncbi:3-hydroxyacyl-ACP dehydratase FabZ family protein [Anatilimnocola sp. NA78]|uniref:3-hydroxyacyl-ACP dehydratase FabZ family protein n=1 Tax=Anatilimnocola sp. NA78 TaxID=3415683 RepID=UPI003CE4D9E3